MTRAKSERLMNLLIMLLSTRRYVTRDEIRSLCSLQFQDDVLVGCNSVGWTEHVGVMRGLVEGQDKLGAWKDKLMQDPTRLVEAYQAAAQGQADWSGAHDKHPR